MIKMFETVADLERSGFLFRITDNGGATADRFTITFCDGDYFGSSCYPTHPQGFGQWGERIDVQFQSDRVEDGRERDLRWIDLPEAVRDCVLASLNRGFADYLEAAPAAKSRDEARDWQGLWEEHGDDRTPIYVRDGKFYIRDDDRQPPHDDGEPGPFDSFVEAVRYMLPKDYDLSGPEYHTTVNLWDTEGGPAPLWDSEEEPPHPFEVAGIALDNSTSPHWLDIGEARDADHAREVAAAWREASPDLAPLYRITMGGKVDRTFKDLT